MNRQHPEFKINTYTPELERFAAHDKQLGMLALRTVNTASLSYDGDGLAVFMGLGEMQRLDAAITEWNENSDLKHLFIANANQNESTSIDAVTIRERIDDMGGRLRGVRILENAAHTKAQAEWVRQQVIERDVHAVKLVVPAYHAPRAYATAVAALYQDNMRTPLVVGMPLYPEGYVTPEPVYDGIVQTARNMAIEEAKKIRRHQLGGDVASDEVWDSHILLSVRRFEK